MDDRRVFKPSLVKRVAAWTMIVIFGGLLVGMLVILPQMPIKSSADLWSIVGGGVLVLLLALVGVAGLRTYFVLDGDTIEFVRPFATRRFRVSELGGFGLLLLRVEGVPAMFIRLYAFGLKQVARIPLNLRDRAEVERWLLARLPVVLDDGSAAFAKPRYRDASGRDRDPTFKGAPP